MYTQQAALLATDTLFIAKMDYNKRVAVMKLLFLSLMILLRIWSWSQKQLLTLSPACRPASADSGG